MFDSQVRPLQKKNKARNKQEAEGLLLWEGLS